MTDKDIIKALLCCANANNVLVAGERFEDKGLCCLFKDALDLINRQKAEIKELNEKNVTELSLIGFQKEEIERIILEATEEYKNRIRAEAITEFAERLFDTKFKIGNDYVIYAENIDIIAKEMKGEQ